MASCENKYTTLLDLSRQAKIISGNTACFDGRINAGIPFSGYPTGVDTNTITSLGIVSQQDAVFSGNNITTLFDVSNSASTNYNPIFINYSSSTWTNPLFSANTVSLILPITPLSATTQVVGPVWTLTETGMTGTHIIGLKYTGYSITYSPFNVVGEFSAGSGTYSGVTGFTTAIQQNFSAGTLDYKGPLDYLHSLEDATIDNKLTTKSIKITEGASLGTIGYVLTQSEADGTAIWAPSSGSTGLTNVFVTGGTLNSAAELILTRNDDVQIDVDLSSLSGGTGNTFINTASTPSTIGGIAAGSTFPAPGKTMQEMWDLLLYPYQTPAFTTFSRSDLNSEYEVGESTTIGAKTFSWSTSNGSNVSDLIPGSIIIEDVHGNTLLDSQSKTGAAVGAVILVADSATTVGSQTLYTIGGENTIAGTFTSSISKTWKAMWYYGMAGATLTGAQMTGLTQNDLITSLSFGTLLSATNTGTNYLWVCAPDILTNTGTWNAATIPVVDFAGVTPIPGAFQADISITNSQGLTVNYKVWRQTFSQTSNPYQFRLNNT